MCGEFGLASGGSENLDVDVALRHEAVPFDRREIGITVC